MKKHTVFVSHAHVDNALCDRYVATLRSRGLDVWYDRSNLQAGQELSDEIERQIQQRSALVVMLTEASINSFWVKMEVAAFRDMLAHDSSRVMLPVRIGACEVPALMRGIKWVDALNIPFEDCVNEIGRALGANEHADLPPTLSQETVSAAIPVQDVPTAGLRPYNLPDTNMLQAAEPLSPTPPPFHLPSAQPTEQRQASSALATPPGYSAYPPLPTQGGVWSASTTGPLRFASYGARVAAFLLDGLIVYAPTAILVGVLFAIFGASDNGGPLPAFGIGAVAALYPTFMVTGPIYLAVYWARSGQTLGNRALHIKVIREDGRLLSLWQGLLRSFVGMLIVNNIVIYLGWLLPVWDKKKQALHDKLVNSIVVSVR